MTGNEIVMYVFIIPEFLKMHSTLFCCAAKLTVSKAVVVGHSCMAV